MAKENFDEALRRLLLHEGGYSNHPSDPGGPTKYGITLANYRRHVKADATAADMRAMPKERAVAIYRAHYWDALRCDDLKSGIDYAAFDYGVNSGVGRAAKVLQRLLGLPDDGRMSQTLVSAVNRQDAAAMVARICDERLAFLKSLKTWPVFGAGWGRRVSEVRSAALAMARASQAAAAPARTAPAPSSLRTIAAGTAVVIGAGSGGYPFGFAVGGAVIAAAAFAAIVWIVRAHRRRRDAEALR